MASSIDQLKLIADRFKGKAVGNGFVVCCPAHDDASPSLAVWIDESDNIRYKCYAGCDHGSIKAAFKENGIEIEAKKVAPETLFQKILQASVEIDQTPAAAYLRSRGITAVPPSSAVMYEPKAFSDASGAVYGAILYIVRNSNNSIQAIQKVYLTAEGKKAPITPNKKTIGTLTGGAVILPGSGSGIACEGVEDALSIWQETNRLSLAVLGINYTKLPVGAGMELLVARDNDIVGSTSDKKTIKEIKALIKRGVKVKVAVPDTVTEGKKSDFNDVLLRKGGARVKEIIDAAKEYQAEDQAPPGDGWSEEQALTFLNSKYLVVRDQGKTIVIEEARDEDLERNVRFRLSFADLRNYYCNVKVVINGGNRVTVVPLADFWLTHPKRRQYEAMVFAPGRHVKDKYNLWQGWAVDPEPGDWSLLKQHTFDNICNKDQQLYEYVMKWMARGVQVLDAPNEVALCMRGKRGTGKGTLANAYGRLFGQHFLPVSQAKHLTGNFNAHLRDALFVFADEAFWAGDKQGEAVLKTLITEPMLTIEGKGRDVVTDRNRVKLMVASNQDWMVPAGLEERRFAVCDVADNEMQNKAYFAAITQQMENGGLQAMLHELLNMDLSDFEIRDVPMTQGLLDQKVQSMDPLTKFWFEKLQDGKISALDASWPATILKDAMYEQLRNWYTDQGLHRKLAKSDVSLRIKKYIPNIEEGRDRHGRFWVIPPLDVCRRHFDELMKQEIEWEEPSYAAPQDIY
jgi:hypothetical protein